MRCLTAFLLLLWMLPISAADDDAQVKERFKSKNYTVTWGEVRDLPSTCELEFGNGAGHGFYLSWLHFKPVKDRVEILSILLKEDKKPILTKWPPDNSTVEVKRASMKLDEYAKILRAIAVAQSASLTKAPDATGFRTSNAWLFTRVVDKDKAHIDWNWAGYTGESEEHNYAKPGTALLRVNDAYTKLGAKDSKLSDSERGWASAKLARDWKGIQGSDFWWVRERYIDLIGHVGDKSALPTLKEVLKGKSLDHSDGRCIYNAVNAVTRLTGIDLRDKPVESMDLEKVRTKVLESLNSVK